MCRWGFIFGSPLGYAVSVCCSLGHRLNSSLNTAACRSTEKTSGVTLQMSKMIIFAEDSYLLKCFEHPIPLVLMVSTHLTYPNGIENLSLYVYVRIVSVRATYTCIFSHTRVSKINFPCFGSALITVMSVLFHGEKNQVAASCLLPLNITSILQQVLLFA